jgi:putative resolvase
VPERLYTLKEACLLLGLHPRTIQKWDKQGKIRVVRTPGGRRRIPESEIRRLQGEKGKEQSEKASNRDRQSHKLLS